MLTRSILSNSPVCRYVIFVKELLFVPSFVQTVKSPGRIAYFHYFDHNTKSCTSPSVKTNKERTAFNWMQCPLCQKVKSDRQFEPEEQSHEQEYCKQCPEQSYRLLFLATHEHHFHHADSQ